MSRELIGITTARGMGPLPQLLEEMGGSRSVERVFAKAGVPLEVIENTDHSIPMIQMMSLFDHAARETGDSFFGFRVGANMAPGAYGKWVQYASQANTLHNAILRLMKTIRLHQSVGFMELKSQGAQFVWTYGTPLYDKVIQRQHADHVLPVMIRFAQVFLGVSWTPNKVQSMFDIGANSDRPNANPAIEWLRGGKGVSVFFEKEELRTTRPAEVETPLTTIDLLADYKAGRTQCFVAEMEALIATRLLSGLVDLTGLAAFSGKGTRTIQRRLDEHGLSYRNMVDGIRFRKASALLSETNLSLTEIAISLGYSDPAHFTRAFRRWAGRAPSEARLQTIPAQ